MPDHNFTITPKTGCRDPIRTEMDEAPLPSDAAISSRADDDANGTVRRLGGCINSGFSGSAAVLLTSAGRTIAGVITHAECVLIASSYVHLVPFDAIGGIFAQISKNVCASSIMAFIKA